uniref:Pentatricopeptide repeat-containing protein At5g59600 family n=1 Tax=Cajanus cajan TaxID=3821 RepID=A0A151RS04_CAJCA|nr:Pentatricopeptide repeat-containing protein At5g59600 family [Cajanus cajan]
MRSEQGLTPNYAFVIPSVLKACGHVGDQITGEKIHGFILKCSFELDSFVSSSLIVMYSKCAKVEDARKVFDGMSVKDTVALNAIIAGYVQQGAANEALGLVKSMNHGFCPTSATISTLLPACATAARVRVGREIHGYALVTGVEEDIYVRSALVDMYAKCGFISEATSLFSRMAEKNTVTWNSIIFGFANHGYCKEAIELFNQMEKEGAAKLDHLTFTAALTACSHDGDIELGQRLFKIMQEKYGIEPRLEHYACMVDLLGRAGKLVEAYGMIKTMPVEPDLYVWGALLAACRNHGHVELAEVAAMHLMELEPESAANRLLLSSVYADAGKWGKVERIKKRIKKGKLRKLQGLSWIDNL